MSHRPLIAALLICSLLPSVVSAQTGREFVSVEAMVSASRIVYVGQIAEIELTNYDGPLVEPQTFGKPYRVRFDIRETLRGQEQESLELVLSIQTVFYLKYLCDHATELMLVAGPHPLGKNAGRDIGIAEQGKPVHGQWYHFRLLDPLDVPADGDAHLIASQINSSYDNGRMFTSKLQVVRGRDEILQHARDFASQSKTLNDIVLLRIPNLFAEKCGTPNAYSLLSLPETKQTENLLRELQTDPGLILRQVDPQYRAALREMVIDEAGKSLKNFGGDN